MNPPYVESVDETHVTLKWSHKPETVRMTWHELRRAAQGNIRGIAAEFLDLLTEAEVLREAAGLNRKRRVAARYRREHA